ncbi:MAG: hypothetical protein CME70_21915 [Halobacteriovorax sp.]|nr:hypothetical protein [Halobacteriovorax sp.]|tara:strand:- start:62553 stop:63539 length:987 start_codon:yes stop_codon:yes gene_type:complete
MAELIKILIRAPSELEHVSKIFPLLLQLKVEYPESQIHILISEDSEAFYKALPFDVFTYVLNESELSLPGIHKFAVNQNEIFNIDLYLDLENSFKSAFVGFSFKAKNRIGYIKGINKFLLTHKVEPFESYRPDKVYLKLLESYLKKDLSELKIEGSKSRELLSSKKTEELLKLPPYFLIKVTNLLNKKEFWNDFFRFFEEQYFVIWFDPSEGEEKYNELKDYFKSLEQKNIYLVKTGKEESFLKHLVHSVGFLTTDKNWSYLGSFLGVCTYTFVKRASDLSFMEHFKDAPVLIEMDNEIPVKWISQEKNEPIETVDRLVNILHEIHEL